MNNVIKVVESYFEILRINSFFWWDFGGWG